MHAACLFCEDRLIPACAGKTRIPFLSSTAARAHPRVCGENQVNDFNTGEPAGSSPRVRGKPAVIKERIRAKRLIPACAGKTIVIAVRVFEGRAHPRVCGENILTFGDLPKAEGSSPRVRGKLFCR